MWVLSPDEIRIGCVLGKVVCFSQCGWTLSNLLWACKEKTWWRKGDFPFLLELGHPSSPALGRRCSCLSSFWTWARTGTKAPGWLGGKESTYWCRRDTGSIPGSGRSSRVGNGNPLQYSCLENSMTEKPDRLQSIGSQRAGHNWNNLVWMHMYTCMYMYTCEGARGPMRILYFLPNFIVNLKLL